MSTLASAELDSEEEDDDYVPDQDPLERAEQARIAAEDAAAAKMAAPFDPHAPIIEFAGRAGAASRTTSAAAKKRAAARRAAASGCGGAGSDGGGTGTSLAAGAAGNGVDSMEQALVGRAAVRKRKMDSLWSELNGTATVGEKVGAQVGERAVGVGGAGAAGVTPGVGDAVAAKAARKKERLLAKLLGKVAPSSSSSSFSSAKKDGIDGDAKKKKKKKKRKKNALLEFTVPDAPPPRTKRARNEAGTGSEGSSGGGGGGGTREEDAAGGSGSAASGHSVTVKPAKVTVTEKVKYAGQEIEVTKTYLAGTREAAEATAREAETARLKSAGGLDAALSAIKGGTSISTVAKSSGDWDTFKEEHDLTDELAQATKDGYLQKQDFLARVDGRKFEQEKAARELERSKRAKN